MADYNGTSGNDRLTGGTGEDRFEGFGGDDVIKGQGGVDTAVFSGNMSEYSWTASSKGWDITGPDGSDSLEGIEFLEFDDFTWNLDGDNTPVFTHNGLSFTTDVNTSVDINFSGYDIDAPGFIAYISTADNALLRTSYVEYAIASGRGVDSSYVYDPARRGDYSNAPLSVTDSYTFDFVYRYGSSQDGYTNIDAQIVVYGINDAPEIIRQTYSNLTTYVIEDAGPVAYDLQAFADDVDSDDDSSTLIWEVVGKPDTLSAWFVGQTLYVDPGSNYQLLSKDQYVTETISIRAIDQHGAMSETLDYSLRVGGADDPLPNYRNSDGSANYIAIGTNPNLLSDRGIISGLENDPNNLTYTQHTNGDDLLAIRGQAMGYFQDSASIYNSLGLSWDDLSIHMGAGNDTALVKLDGDQIEMQSVELNMTEGENLVVLDFDAAEFAVLRGSSFDNGAHSSQMIVDIDSDGSAYFVGNSFGFGNGNDLLHVMITATGRRDAFPFQTVLNFNNSYSMGGGKDRIILDFDVTDGGEMEFSDTIYTGTGNDYVRLDNLDSSVTVEFPSAGEMGFTGRIDTGADDDVIDFFWKANSDETAKGTIDTGLGTDTLNLWGDRSEWTIVQNTSDWQTLTNGGQTIEVIGVEIVNYGVATPTGGDGENVPSTSNNETLEGGAAADVLVGREGDDMISGNGGDDLLAGGSGFDRLVGGDGRDQFVFTAGSGLKIVYDYTDSVDQIALLGFEFDDLTITSQRGTEVLIEAGDTRMILRNTDVGELDVSDFVTITESDLL